MTNVADPHASARIGIRHSALKELIMHPALKEILARLEPS
jgi:hypothetical protein